MVQPKKTSPKGLTKTQEAFVREYLISFNATEAYKKAGYRVRNDATANSSASKLLRMGKVAAAIATAIARRTERTEITQDRVLQILLVEATRTGRDSQHSARVKAAELLGKHLGMFKESDLHLHQHNHAGNTALSFLDVLKQLPDDGKLQLLDAIRSAKQKQATDNTSDHPATGGNTTAIITTSAPDTTDPNTTIIDTTAEPTTTSPSV